MENAIISASYSWSQFTPAFVLVGLACLILMADCFIPKFPKRGYALIAALGAILTGCGIARYSSEPMANFAFLACIATGLCLLLSFDYTKIITTSIAGGDEEEGSSEFYALPLIACAGIVSLTMARDLVMLFVSLETLTLSSYVLAGYFRRNQGSIEAGVKYLILGAMSTGILVFGAAWYFGATGSFRLDPIAIHGALSGLFVGAGAVRICLSLSLVFLFIGAFFKVGAAPMHMWIPDVYQGAPTPTSTFLAVASKAAGFVVLSLLIMPFSYFTEADSPYSGVVSVMVHVLAIVAAATLLIGNLGAINQANAKRLLGYSSIGQAGFILVFFLNPGLGEHVLSNVYLYLLAYTLATVAAFAAIAMVRTQRGSEEISAFRGLGKTNPRTAFLITVSFASLAGVPLTMGFIAKFQSFVALIYAMDSWKNLTWLLPVMIVCAAVGFYYYFKVLRAMYWEKPQAGDQPLRVPGITVGILTACAVAIILLGTLPLLINIA